MKEFELIETYFRPLAQGFAGSLNLADDAALLEPPPGMQLVITKDAISEGVHFLGTESPAFIAKKLLRTNLSDLAGKGAALWCYFLAIALPQQGEDASRWIASFASGLAEDQSEFGIHLAGGDSTRSKAGVFLSLTAVGLVPHGGMLPRRGALPGQGIYVSGTLGDSALGLEVISACRKPADPHPCPLPEREREFLISRYLLPQPRLALGLKLRGLATSCMDISDGLVQDLGHLCRASGVGAVIHAGKLPLSDAAKAMPEALQAALSGGDDYELLFTSSHDLSALALPCPVTRIGEITHGSGVQVLDAHGQPMTLDKKGFQHF